MRTPFVLSASLLTRAGFAHAFFTRGGGAGTAASALQELDFSSGLPAETTARNLTAAAYALGVEPSRVYYASQVHGRDAVVVSGTENRAAILQQRGDAVLSRVKGIACAVRTADCVPILVGDTISGAVAAIHSGWQGAVRGVIAAAIGALVAPGERPYQLVAAIGPHIGACCFEVGEDVAQELAACSPAEGVIDRDRGAKPHVDLRRVVRAQLKAAGLDEARIEEVPGCTRCDAVRFFSFRRDREESGRHLAAIVASGA